MVRRSTDNYDGFKADIKEYYLTRNPKSVGKVNEFINYISSIYDNTQRVYFSHKFLKYLYLRRSHVIKKNQHFWIAFIGKKGGEGKSTLAKQVLHFLDKDFHTDTRCAHAFEKFIMIIKQAKGVEKKEFPSVLLDEVDPKLHHAEKDARTLRSITTKLRQMNLFVGVCANSLNDIPAFIFERINTIVKIDDKHRFWVYDNNYDSPKFSICDDIKKEWASNKHAIFNRREIIKRAIYKNQSFAEELPFIEGTYLEEKEQDLFNDIDMYLTSKNGKPIPKYIPPYVPPTPDRMDLEIIKAKNEGESSPSIGARFKRTRQQVNRIWKKYKLFLKNSENGT